MNGTYEKLLDRRSKLNREEFLKNVGLRVSGYEDSDGRKLKSTLAEYFDKEGKEKLLDNFIEYMDNEIKRLKSEMEKLSIEFE